MISVLVMSLQYHVHILTGYTVFNSWWCCSTCTLNNAVCIGITHHCYSNMFCIPKDWNTSWARQTWERAEGCLSHPTQVPWRGHDQIPHCTPTGVCTRKRGDSGSSSKTGVPQHSLLTLSISCILVQRQSPVRYEFYFLITFNIIII